MTDKLAKYNAFANARIVINREYFGDGDRRHQLEYTNRRKQASVCNGMLGMCCQ